MSRSASTTPVSSSGGSRRRSMGVNSAEPMLLDENDDEEEQTQRRRSRRMSLRFGPNVGLDLDAENAEDAPVLLRNMLDNYSSVLKMCSENKVNTKNTWSLNLIDHIEDILATQRGSFQKASCTLSASVQIYEKRVDAAHEDTFRMLNNVNRNNNRGANDGEEQRDLIKKGKGRGSKRGGSGGLAANTLEKNLANITQNKVDREFEVDPLFKKMSMAFDEGGARGMLLNQLGVHRGCEIVFDTSSVQAMVRPQDTEPQTEDQDTNKHEEDEEEFTMPLLYVSDDMTDKLEGLIGHCKNARAAPSIDVLFGLLKETSRGHVPPEDDEAQGGDGPLDFHNTFGDHDDDEYEDDGDFGDMGGDGPDGWSDAGSVPDSHRRTSTHGDAIGAFDVAFGVDGDEDGDRRKTIDPRRASRGPIGVTQSGGNLRLEFVHDGPDSEYSYFDTSGGLGETRSGGGTLKEKHSWAGPTHWKFMGQRAAAAQRAKQLRNGGAGVLVKTKEEQEEADGEEEGANEGGENIKKKPKKKKAKVFVNFSIEVDSESELAWPDKKSASLLLTKTVRAVKLPEALKSNTLPRDEHCKLDDLRRLFLWPETRLQGFAFGGGINNNNSNNNIMELEIRDADMNTGTLGRAQDENDDDSYDGGDGGFGFGGFDDYDDSDDEGGNNIVVIVRKDSLFEDSFDPTQGLNMVGAGRHVDKVQIGYETRAKRVDVRALKKSLWRHITHEAPRVHIDLTSQEDVSMHEAPVDVPMSSQIDECVSVVDGDEEGEENEIEEMLHFSDTVGALAPDQAAAVTVPFYFICVLHLANERGLDLKGSPDLSDFRISVEGEDEKEVGEEAGESKAVEQKE